MDKKGNLVDRESRVLAHHINTMRKPVEMDEAEARVGGGWVDRGGGGRAMDAGWVADGQAVATAAAATAARA